MANNLIEALNKMDELNELASMAENNFRKELLKTLSETDGALTVKDLARDDMNLPEEEKLLARRISHILGGMNLQQTRHHSSFYGLHTITKSEKYYIAEVDEDGNLLSEPKPRHRERKAYYVSR